MLPKNKTIFSGEVLNNVEEIGDNVSLKKKKEKNPILVKSMTAGVVVAIMPQPTREIIKGHIKDNIKDTAPTILVILFIYLMMSLGFL